MSPVIYGEGGFWLRFNARFYSIWHSVQYDTSADACDTMRNEGSSLVRSTYAKALLLTSGFLYHGRHCFYIVTSHLWTSQIENKTMNESSVKSIYLFIYNNIYAGMPSSARLVWMGPCRIYCGIVGLHNCNGESRQKWFIYIVTECDQRT